jgi:ATP-dependent Clp protease protease subunit
MTAMRDRSLAATLRRVQLFGACIQALGSRGLVAFAGPVVPFARRSDGTPGYTIKAKGAEAGEIYIYGDIGEDWFGEGNTAKGFADELKALGAIKTLDVYINSPGGSVFEGVAIYNILLRHRARKVVHIDGLAASIASVIAMAGDEIVMARNSLMMIHNPWGIAMGEATDFRKMADSLDKIGGAITDTYVSRTGQSAEDVGAMMDAETWLNAEEAVAQGFADQVSEPMDVAAFAGLDVSKFRRPPEALKAAAAAAPAAPPAEEDPEAQAGAGRKPHLALAKADARLRRRGLLPA